MNIREKSAQSEINRLRELRLYRVLDTAAEKIFDDLTGLASAICGSSISLISLVDEHRQWFKSHHGLDATETPREYAFCAHAIQSDALMIVEDAQKDERFANNPLVLGDPNIRFYAGMPLVMRSGSALGTLCVIDSKPATLSDEQKNALAVLRNAVVSHLELRRARYDLEDLQKVLPMCAWCRKIRTEEEPDTPAIWQPLHEFVANLGEVTHGICPECKAAEFASK